MFFDEIVSCWELNRSVRLPFCLRFPEFVCCLREAITEASKRLNISGLKVKQQETIEGFCQLEGYFCILFLQNTVNLGVGSRACLYRSKAEVLGAYSVLKQQISLM